MKRLLCLCLCLFALAVNAEEKNSVIICDNSLEMFGWDLEFIRHAEHSIDISACYLGGTIGRELLTEIEARLEVCPNIQVRILATPVLLEQADYDMIERLKRTYPKNFQLVHATNVVIVWPEVTGIDNHVKVCVVDEQYFSMGGTNLDITQCAEGTYPVPRCEDKLNPVAKSLAAGHRDQDIVGRGPMAKELRKLFCKIFAMWVDFNKRGRLEQNPDAFSKNFYYFEITEKPFVEEFEASEQLITLEDHEMKFLFSGPHQKKNPITQEYVRMIKGAKKEISIANLYLSPTDEIFDALKDAVKRGVKLTIITNGIGDIPPDYTKYFCWGNRVSYLPLFHGQAFYVWDYWSAKKKKPKETHIYEYHVKDILLHKKVIIVDDETFAIGSYNLGMKSHLSDYETLMVMRSPEVVREAKKVYARDLEHSREVPYKDAFNWYFDPATSYMGEIQKRFSGLL